MFRDLKEYQAFQKIYQEQVFNDKPSEEELNILLSDLLREGVDLEEFVEYLEESFNENNLEEKVVNKSVEYVRRTPFGKNLLKKGAKYGDDILNFFKNKLKGKKSIEKVLRPNKRNKKFFTDGKFDQKKYDKAVKEYKAYQQSLKNQSNKSNQNKNNNQTKDSKVDDKKGNLPKGTKVVGALATLGIAGQVKKSIDNKNKKDDKKEIKVDNKPEINKDQSDAKKEDDLQKVLNNKKELQKIETDNKDVKVDTKDVKVDTKDIKKEINKTDKPKMSQIEKDNRQRFGDKRVDFLKQKQKDFKLYKKGDMTKAKFIDTYPQSQTAKNEYIRKNPNSSIAMQNMSYEPQGEPIQETFGYDPIKNHYLAKDLASVYQSMYEKKSDPAAQMKDTAPDKPSKPEPSKPSPNVKRPEPTRPDKGSMGPTGSRKNRSTGFSPKMRDKMRDKMAQKAQPVMKNEEYTPYDFVLEYLLSTEQVDTIEEANYVMTEMDAETIQAIVEEQKKNLDEGLLKAAGITALAIPLAGAVAKKFLKPKTDKMIDQGRKKLNIGGDKRSGVKEGVFADPKLNKKYPNQPKMTEKGKRILPNLPDPKGLGSRKTKKTPRVFGDPTGEMTKDFFN